MRHPSILTVRVGVVVLTLAVAQAQALAQEAGPPAAQDTALTVVETMPEFPGGQAELFKYLGKETRYPQDALEKEVQGTVYVTFVVAKDGSITDVGILRGVFPSIDAEAVRVVRSMPLWTPGTQQGKPVNVKYSMPIKFAITSGRKKKSKR